MDWVLPVRVGTCFLLRGIERKPPLVPIVQKLPVLDQLNSQQSEEE